MTLRKFATTGNFSTTTFSSFTFVSFVLVVVNVPRDYQIVKN